MRMLKKCNIAFFLILIMILAGCGGGSSGEQNGSISLSLSSNDSGTGVYDVDATAVVSISRIVSEIPPQLSGIPVKFVYTISTNSNQTGTTDSVESETDETGTARYSFKIIQQDEPIRFKVTAGTGDVKSAAQYVTIPAFISPTN
jgi:hypothetical protein